MTTIRLETHRPIPIEAATEKADLGQTGPSHRVRLGIERNRTTAPELHPERALSVTRSYRETEGQPLAGFGKPGGAVPLPFFVGEPGP